MNSTGARVMIHVQHLLGSGHQHRMSAISRALIDAGACVTYVSGGMPVPGLDTGAADFVQLPPARIADADYTALLDADGAPVSDAWRDRRRDRLLAVYARVSPHVLLTETYPFGRRLLRFELLPLLSLAAKHLPKPAVVCSVRDLIEPRSRPGSYADMAEIVLQHYDRVLVHTDESLFDFGMTFPQAARIESRLAYTGFVCASSTLPRAGHRGIDAVDDGDSHEVPEVVVSAGGGAVGAPLLHAGVGASALDDANRHWRVLVGPALPASARASLDDAAGKARAAGASVTVEGNRSDFRQLLEQAQVSVSQSGYNTVIDILSTRVGAVLVPFASGGEREQSVRASRLAQLGLVRVLEERSIDPEGLLRAVNEASVLSPDQRPLIAMDGARTSARLIHEMVRCSSDGGARS